MLEGITSWVTNSIAGLGYLGIVIMMAIESANIPLPSEIIMPYGGFLVSKNPAAYSLMGMGLAGAFGCLVGSVVSYWIGSWGGRPFVMRYGKYFLITRRDLDRADRWFAKYGDFAIFLSRLLPVVRTFISFPAGISKMNFWRFSVYTFVGSFPWCLMLAWVGKILGDRWDTIKGYFHGADVLIIGALAIMLILYVYHHIRAASEPGEAE
jgi:membrane protein DedA with SNARE-associated domain